MTRLSAAGFKRDFARVAVLPDWWDTSCESDPGLLPDVEIRVARFIGAPLEVVRNPALPLVSPRYEGARLRRVRDIKSDRLAPAIHAALQVAGAVVRTMRPQPIETPSSDPLAWRASIKRTRPLLQLTDVLGDLWGRGIPVIHLAMLPAPSFQGLACIAEGRPVIVLGHDLDEPARIAFIVAHEVGHIVSGDCTADHPVIDEQEEVADDHEMEKRADAFAAGVMTGGASVPDVQAAGFKDLATKAGKLEKLENVDASAIVWAWARRTGNYGMATMAAQALYRTTGGKRMLRSHLDQNIKFDCAPDSDRSLLRCLVGDADRDAAAS